MDATDQSFIKKEVSDIKEENDMTQEILTQNRLEKLLSDVLSKEGYKINAEAARSILQMYPKIQKDWLIKVLLNQGNSKNTLTVSEIEKFPEKLLIKELLESKVNETELEEKWLIEKVLSSDLTVKHKGKKCQPFIIRSFQRRFPDRKVTYTEYPGDVRQTIICDGIPVMFRCNAFLDDDKILEVSFFDGNLDECFKIDHGSLRKYCTDSDKIQLYMYLYDKKQCFYVLDNLDDKPHEELVEYNEERVKELFPKLKEFWNLTSEYWRYKKQNAFGVTDFTSWLYFPEDFSSEIEYTSQVRKDLQPLIVASENIT